MNFLTELLNTGHNRKNFACGNKMLDNYFRYQAGQDVKRKLSACFVWPEEETGIIKGYYTLSNNSIPLDSVPDNIRRKLPGSYTSIPVTLLGRLAVNKIFQQKGIGKLLLIDALKRSCLAGNQTGSFAAVVDPVNKQAELFYKKYGFIKLPDSGKMFIPMKTVEKLFV
jgi:GNAT superfamily N-acetyltransferase